MRDAIPCHRQLEYRQILRICILYQIFSQMQVFLPAAVKANYYK
jgi:hypothetical protein